MTGKIYSESFFIDYVYNDRQLSIAYNLLRHVFLMNTLDRGTYKLLGHEFNQWDEDTFNLLINKLQKLYHEKFTVDSITNLWNSGDSTIHYDKETIRKKLRIFEKREDILNQYLFSLNDKLEILKYVYCSLFGKDTEIIGKVLCTIHEEIPQKYSSNSKGKTSNEFERKLYLYYLKDIEKLGLTLDISNISSKNEEFIIFKSIEDKIKALLNIEEQIERKYHIKFKKTSSKYCTASIGGLKYPLTNIPIDFLQYNDNIIINEQDCFLTIEDRFFYFDIPYFTTEIKSENTKTKFKEGNLQKVYNAPFVSEFIKFLREDLENSNRTFKKVHYYDFPTRNEIYNSLLTLKDNKELLIDQVGFINNQIIIIILSRLIDSFFAKINLMNNLYSILVIFCGIHYKATFNRYYNLSDKLISSILNTILYLSSKFFCYTLQNILFENDETYCSKFNLYFENQYIDNQIDLFELYLKYCYQYINVLYRDTLLPLVKDINYYCNIKSLLLNFNETMEVEGLNREINSEYSCLMREITSIEKSYQKIINRLEEEYELYDSENHQMLEKYYMNISDKLVKDVEKRFNSFMLGDLNLDWDVYFQKGNFYEKFELEYQNFISQLRTVIPIFMVEKNFSDNDKKLMKSYLDTIGIVI